MSAFSASLSVDESQIDQWPDMPPPFPPTHRSSLLSESDSPGKRQVSESHSRSGSKCEQAAMNSAAEQKLWIQCTLNGAKHRGEDWIEPIFKDEESTGCSACLPDIVIVNDDKFSGSFASKAPAPWQRIFTKDEADNCIANHRSRAAPEAAFTMPFCGATSIPDTYLYQEKRLICFFLYGQPSSMICNASCVLQVVRTRSENLRQILYELLF
jgi:hypothetical protein